LGYAIGNAAYFSFAKFCICPFFKERHLLFYIVSKVSPLHLFLNDSLNFDGIVVLIDCRCTNHIVI